MFCLACGSKPCPDVSVGLNYFPYYEGQELKFTNSQNNTQTFIIANKRDKDSGSAMRSGKGNFCNSCTQFDINSTQDIVKMNYSINVNGSLDKVWNVLVVVHLFKELHSNELLEINIKKNCSYKNLSKYLEDTITIENRTNQIVKKVVIVKGKGLVSYTTADGEEWKLVE